MSTGIRPSSFGRTFNTSIDRRGGAAGTLAADTAGDAAEAARTTVRGEGANGLAERHPASAHAAVRAASKPQKRPTTDDRRPTTDKRKFIPDGDGMSCGLICCFTEGAISDLKGRVGSALATAELVYFDSHLQARGRG